MLTFFQSEPLNIAVLVLISLWGFPIWAERMLRLKRYWGSHRRKSFRGPNGRS